VTEVTLAGAMTLAFHGVGAFSALSLEMRRNDRGFCQRTVRVSSVIPSREVQAPIASALSDRFRRKHPAVRD